MPKEIFVAPSWKPRDLDLEVLRQRWDAGKASGRAEPLDISRLIAEERAKLERDAKRKG